MPKQRKGEPIRPVVGRGHLTRQYRGKSWMHILVELIKNSRDWGATAVFLYTRLDGTSWFRIVDNGYGMNGGNRISFTSLGQSTCSEESQSGEYDTAVKYAIFISQKVIVRTAPKDEPDLVYVFEVTPEQLEDCLRPGCDQTIETSVYDKDNESWPYLKQFRFGTEITFVLKDANFMTRGETLARQLAARLPTKFKDIIQVDGQPIPDKEIEGSKFTQDEVDKHVGPFSLELYRPKHRRREDGLRFAAREIGEAPFANLLHHLDDDLKDLIPRFLFDPHICGVIQADFLRDHSMENRFELRASIGSDARIPYLLRRLAQYEAEVRSRLGLRDEAPVAGKDDEAITSFTDRCNKRYGGGQKPPTGVGPPGPVCPPPTGPGDPPVSKAVIHISCGREFEINEPVVVTVKIDANFAAVVKMEDIVWYLKNTRATLIEEDRANGRMVFKADQGTGVGSLRVEVRGRPGSYNVSYNIVPERVLRMHAPFGQVPRGHEYHLTVYNSDKVEGELIWKVDGVGSVSGNAGRGVFSSEQLGSATVTVFDSRKKTRNATCDITVVERINPNRLVRIREHWFEISTQTTKGSDLRPVVMVLQPRFSKLFIYKFAPGYEEAATTINGLCQFLAQAAALEFVKFKRLTVDHDRDLEDMELDKALEEVQAEAYRIFREIFVQEDPQKKD